MAINPVLISVSVTGKRRKRRDLDTVIQVSRYQPELEYSNFQFKGFAFSFSMSCIGAEDALKKALPPIGDNNDDNPGQPVRRHQPWAWGEDSRDAGEESQWLSQLYRLSQVLEKFMSTVPENTNYQQQVLFESTFKAASWPSAQRCCRCTSLARATRRSPTPASTEWCASTPTRSPRSNKRNGTWSRCEYSLVLLAQCTMSEVVEEIRRLGWFRDRLTSLNAPVDASWLILVKRECEA